MIPIARVDRVTIPTYLTDVYRTLGTELEFARAEGVRSEEFAIHKRPWPRHLRRSGREIRASNTKRRPDAVVHTNTDVTGRRSPISP